MSRSTAQQVPRLERLRVMNYRALKDLDLKDLQPLTVFLGANGSGKSTIFDVFAFLAECFSVGLRKAWDRRGRFRELRTRGEEGPITIELKYREKPGTPLITYHLEIDEGPRGPFVAVEWLHWKRKSFGAPFQFLDFAEGTGRVISGEVPDEDDERIEEALESPDLLAVNTLGPRLLPELAEECRIAAARSQLMVTTHSPYFVNGLRPKELWVLDRDEYGFTRAVQASDIRGVLQFVEEGAHLGHLWMEGHFVLDGQKPVAVRGGRRG